MTVSELDKLMEKVMRKRYPDMKGVYHPSPGRWIFGCNGEQPKNLDDDNHKNTIQITFIPEKHAKPEKSDKTDDLMKSFHEFLKTPEHIEHRKQVELEIKEMRELGWCPEAIADDL